MKTFIQLASVLLVLQSGLSSLASAKCMGENFGAKGEGTGYGKDYVVCHDSEKAKVEAALQLQLGAVKDLCTAHCQSQGKSCQAAKIVEILNTLKTHYNKCSYFAGPTEDKAYSGSGSESVQVRCVCRDLPTVIR